MRTRPFGCLALCLVCLLATGCSASTRRPIKGSVDYKGEPVNGSITFLRSGVSVGGGLIKNGAYDIPAEHGLEPGSYGVSISYPDGIAKRTPEEIEAGASARAAEKLPAKYNSATTLTLEVPASGPVVGDFRLD